MKAKTIDKGLKPEKVEKKKKKVKLTKKKDKGAIEFYSQIDIHSPSLTARKRGISARLEQANLELL